MPKYSPKEVAENYKHIELTPEEELEGILWAKQKKERELQAKRIKEIEAKNRKALSSSQWSYKQTNDFMLYRASEIFSGKFILDQQNKFLFELLCQYFSDSKDFISLAAFFKIENPSLNKGIMLAGNFGTGKTWLMKLFAKNQRQVFHVYNAKEIANNFESFGQEDALDFVNKKKNPTNDSNAFYQPFAGLCIDDIGTEDIKNHYGNKKNVIGDLIEQRYSHGNTGVFFHATTNFSSQQLKDFYGERVTSRMREIFNFIDIPGSDRRK